MMRGDLERADGGAPIAIAHDRRQSELPAYGTVNLGITHDFLVGSGNRFKARVDVTNVGDLTYEIRDGQGIGVWAPQYLPRRAIYAGISKNF